MYSGNILNYKKYKSKRQYDFAFTDLWQDISYGIVIYLEVKILN